VQVDSGDRQDQEANAVFIRVQASIADPNYGIFRF
jgi:hypothetical protein